MLSGGQKARVALARSVYADKDVYFIDDIFSAVDSATGNQIYRKCLMGLLRDKTRVLCTHHTKYLAAADEVLVMDKGNVVDKGLPHEILAKVDFGHREGKKQDNAKNQADNHNVSIVY